ncbi:MAG: glucose-6-phosphate dehydrogenase assembly protein OpcA [Propionibacteriaceae bacterium]|jgi:glucose-6-phosphate dehydrogenase assembly protein OpcA|nr:glucose-6-phosphate dehydrogenase assembly protein OpcA [Propionibacteriaceae bacterium]
MIIPLYDTTANAVADKLVEIREVGGATALGRVLTLIVPVGASAAEAAITAANEASMEHPCRVLVLVDQDPSGRSALDAEIRVGGDAGASEVVVLRMRGELTAHQATIVIPLLLPDAPNVAWWPDHLPAVPAADPVGALATRRVTDALNSPGDVAERLARLRGGYQPGDTDLCWTRITLWRAQIAAVLDNPPYEPVEEVVVGGRADHPSVDLLAAWLGARLDCPVRIDRQGDAPALTRVELHRPSGSVVLDRPRDSSVATLTTPGMLDRRIHLSRRSVAECLAEELRRLDPDTVYGSVVCDDLPRLSQAEVILHD